MKTIAINSRTMTHVSSITVRLPYGGNSALMSWMHLCDANGSAFCNTRHGDSTMTINGFHHDGFARPTKSVTLSTGYSR